MQSSFFARLCATHVAILRDPCCDFARPMLRLNVATLRDPKLEREHGALVAKQVAGFVRVALFLISKINCKLEPRCSFEIGVVFKL